MDYPHSCTATREGKGQENEHGFKTSTTKTVWSGKMDVQDSVSERSRSRAGLVDLDLSAVAFCDEEAMRAIEPGDTLSTPLGKYRVEGRRVLDQVLMLSE